MRRSLVWLLAKNYIDKAIGTIKAGKVTSLDDNVSLGAPIEAAGMPTYVKEADLPTYSDYGITEVGWYVFARVSGGPVGETFSIEGAAGYIEPIAGAKSVDVAVKFGVAAESQKVIINWGAKTEVFVFKATDLAVRNLDYRVTFYLYDIDPYCTWTYGLTTDTTFKENRKYFTLVDGEYVEQEVTVGQSVPANTYYDHKSLVISGFVRNVSYTLDCLDCPVTINLPEVEDDSYGAWFELQYNADASRSITLVAPTGIRVSAKGVASPKTGINIINLQYHKPTKVWLPTLTNWTLT